MTTLPSVGSITSSLSSGRVQPTPGVSSKEPMERVLKGIHEAVLTRRDVAPSDFRGSLLDTVSDIGGSVRSGHMLFTFVEQIRNENPTRFAAALSNDALLNYSALYSVLLYAPLFSYRCYSDIESFNTSWRESGFKDALYQDATDAWKQFNLSCGVSTVGYAVFRGAEVAAAAAGITGNASALATSTAITAVSGPLAFGIGALPGACIAVKCAYDHRQTHLLHHEIAKDIKAKKADSEVEYPHIEALRELQEKRTITVAEVMEKLPKDAASKKEKLETLAVERSITIAKQNLHKIDLSTLSDEEKAIIEDQKTWTDARWRSYIEKRLGYAEKYFKESEGAIEALLSSMGIQEEVTGFSSIKELIGFCIYFMDESAKKDALLRSQLGSETYDRLFGDEITPSTVLDSFEKASFGNKAQADALEQTAKEILQDTLSKTSWYSSSQIFRGIATFAGVCAVIASILFVISCFLTPVGQAGLAIGVLAALFWLIASVYFIYVDGKLTIDALRNQKEPLTLAQKIGAALIVAVGIAAVAVMMVCILNPHVLAVLVACGVIYGLWLTISLGVRYHKPVHNACKKLHGYLWGVPKTLPSSPIAQLASKVELTARERMKKLLESTDTALQELVKKKIQEKFGHRALLRKYKERFDRMLEELSDQALTEILRDNLSFQTS